MLNSDALIKWKLQNEEKFILNNSFILSNPKKFYDPTLSTSIKLEFDISFLQKKTKINILSYSKFTENLPLINHYIAALFSGSSITNVTNINHIIKVFNDIKKCDNSAIYKIIQPCILLKEKKSYTPNDDFILLNINNRVTAAYLHNILCITDLWDLFVKYNKYFFSLELFNHAK